MLAEIRQRASLPQFVDGEAGEGNRAATGCRLGFVYRISPLPMIRTTLRVTASVPAVSSKSPISAQQFAAPQPGRDQDRERVGKVMPPAVSGGSQPYQQIAQLGRP